MQDNKGKLNKCIDNFLSEEDISKENVGLIEYYLISLFPEELFEETIEKLASYEPGGGDFLYDKNDIKKELEYIKKELKTHE